MMMQLTAYASNQRLLITRDVTQIERLETTCRDFVANVSHELRTPLTVLAGFLETLRDMPDDALPAEQRAQYLDMMHEQAQRMQAIVEDLLTLSTLESSPGGDPRAVNIGALLQKARQQIEALSGGRQAGMACGRVPGRAGRGDRADLGAVQPADQRRALHPDGGTITVRWEREDDGGAHYSVQDTGIGIPARHIPG